MWIASPHLRGRLAEDRPPNQSLVESKNEQRAALYCLFILAVTPAVLWAGPFEAEAAETSALCWGLGSCFLAVSLLLWSRTGLGRLATMAGMGQDFDAHTTTTSRGLLIALTVLPVVILSAFATLCSLAGPGMPGPLAGSGFASIGPVAVLVIPLLMVCVGLVGHALREASAGYAFSAGAVANFAVTAGYLSAVLGGGNSIGIVESVRLLQLATITAAGWALLALASRRWVQAWRESPDRPMAQTLFSLQLLQPVLGNAILLFSGIGLLVCQFPGQPSWSVEVGSPLGWAALILALAAVIWRAVHQGRLPIPQSFGVLGLLVVGLFACSVLGWHPAWAYRTLLLGWALFMPALVGSAWLWSRRQTNPAILGSVLAPPVVASWVRFTGIAVVLLGSYAAVVLHDHLWAASAIAIAGTAGAAMAVWRRREDWAFVAGLAVNLAASMVVWHVRFEMPFESWWLYLVQANILSAALVGLLWLGARRLLYADAQLGLQSTPLLATQIALAFGGNAMLLVWPCIRIVLDPWNPVLAELAPIGSLLGWVTLSLAAAAALWYASLESREQRSHVLLFAGLLFGILAGISEGVSHPEQTWLTYHILLATWTGLGLLLVAAEPLSRLHDSASPGFSPFPYFASFLEFSAKHFQSWLLSIGILVMLLALRSAGSDPQRPYWSSGATLAVALMAGATAIRSRSQGIVYLSGLLVPLTGCLTWIAWNPLGDVAWPPAAFSLGYTLLLGLAISSMLWSLVEFILRSGTPLVTLRAWQEMGTSSGPQDRIPENVSSQPVPVPISSQPHLAPLPAFAHVAAWLAAILGGLLLVGSFLGDLMFTGLPVTWLLPAAALTVLGFAFLAFLWDADAPGALAGLYATGLLALGLGQQSLALTPDRFGWTAALALAGYVFLTALLGSILPRLEELWRALRLKPQPAWPGLWFLASQTVLGVLVIGLSAWIVLAFAGLNDRLAGALAIAPLVLTGILLATSLAELWAKPVRSGTLGLAVVLVVELGWATLDPGGLDVKLHRHVLLLLALAAMTLCEGVILPRVLSGFIPWVESGAPHRTQASRHYHVGPDRPTRSRGRQFRPCYQAHAPGFVGIDRSRSRAHRPDRFWNLLCGRAQYRSLSPVGAASPTLCLRRRVAAAVSLRPRSAQRA